MLHIIKKEINMSKELLSRIEWTCKMKKVKPEIINGCLRIVEHTNLAYVEPHRVIIKDKLYLFFNEQNYFYIDSLENKYPLSKFKWWLFCKIYLFWKRWRDWIWIFWMGRKCGLRWINGNVRIRIIKRVNWKYVNDKGEWIDEWYNKTRCSIWKLL